MNRELFDDEEEKDLIAEDEFVDPEEIIVDTVSSARKRWEELLEKRRLDEDLREVFEDFD